jgi:hypothetical protein
LEEYLPLYIIIAILNINIIIDKFKQYKNLSLYNALGKTIKEAIYNERFLYCLNLSMIIFILSIAMMIYSGKYSSNPVHNSRSRTPWTWWKINEEEDN